MSKAKNSKKGKQTAEDDEDWNLILEKEIAANAVTAPQPVEIKETFENDEEGDDGEEEDVGGGKKV